MKHKAFIGFGIMALVFGLMVSVQDQASAESMEDKMMNKIKDQTLVKGDITSPNGDVPFGGNVVGDFYVTVKPNDQVRVFSKLDSSPSSGMVFEGWLVDMNTGYKLSLGKANQKDTLIFTQRLVNSWIYDVLVITEELMHDTDPNPNRPIGGSLLEKPFGQ